jgi:short-subunit dehydrogenase
MKMLVLGATSAIAEAVVRELAPRRASFYLVARNQGAVAAIAADALARGAGAASCENLDLLDFEQHEPMFRRAVQVLGGVDTVLIAHGSLGDQRSCELSVPTMLREIATNGTSVLALATIAAEYLSEQRHGTLVVISSVAGDRGRRSNYVYGSAKALVTTFLSGLRQRLSANGVNVVTVKPGPVDTPMTANMPKSFLWSNAEHVARGIVRAIDRGSPVVYLPGYWRPIMAVIRGIPERTFRKLSL